MNTVLKKTVRLLLLVLLLPVYNWAQTVEIHQIDVGAGDAALINIKNNNGTAVTHSILIDAGNKSGTITQTVIDYVKAHARQVAGQAYLDYIISSHYDADHIGGLVGNKQTAAIGAGSSKKRKCGDDYFTGILGSKSGIQYYAVLDKGDSNPTGTSVVFDDYKTLAGIRRVRVGETILGQGGAVPFIVPPTLPPTNINLPPFLQGLSLGGYIDLGVDGNNVAIKLKLILADGRVFDPSKSPSVTDVGGMFRAFNINNNNWGLGWVLEYGAFRYYTAGDIAGYNDGSLFDIETSISAALPNIYATPTNAPGHICVQKVSHHGSQYSCNELFLGTLKSSLGVISSGSRHEHPTQSIITRLENATWAGGGQLNNNNMAAYLMTELWLKNRDINIDLTKGATSGNQYWVASNPTFGAPGYQAIAPADVYSSYTMTNAQQLYLMKPPPTVSDVSGNVVIKVNATNMVGGTNQGINTNSVYAVEYQKYNGAMPVLSRTINCHHQ